uniref:Aluminum-activated malate transporter n=1 Tax=Fagus sylvatica TaxID=28930 RepID=A0A2N9HP65_FAGSY
MAKEKEVSGKLEWRVNEPDGTSRVLVPESELGHKAWLLWLKGLFYRPISKIWRFLDKSWNLGVAEPQKVIHGAKVGLALLIVSIFYYDQSLYDAVGGYATWAIMTVALVFESNVGATLSKCINRATGTFLAGSLALGVQWIACKSGETFKPIIIGISVFILVDLGLAWSDHGSMARIAAHGSILWSWLIAQWLDLGSSRLMKIDKKASAATFSRFIPSVKTRFDYGAMIFILTFSMVAVSGYRKPVDKLFAFASQRFSTIAVGISLCIIISMLFCPIWAGSELHNLIVRNLEKLADSLEGSVAEYFKDDKTVLGNEEDPSIRIEGYKCVLNSKATEDVMANFARWEPAHGLFNFRHPWKQYLMIGASMRNCAYCIEALNSCVNSEIQAPDYLKKHFSNACMILSSNSSEVLRELAYTMKTMTKSSKIDFLVEEINLAVLELQDSLKSVPNSPIEPTVTTLKAPNPNDANREPITKTVIPSIMDISPLACFVYLLIEDCSKN